MIFFYLFITFFQIGLFGFGGCYGMLSLIQGEVVLPWHWMTTREFTDIWAISQMTSIVPPIAVIPPWPMQAMVMAWPYWAVPSPPLPLCYPR